MLKRQQQQITILIKFQVLVFIYLNEVQLYIYQILVTGFVKNLAKITRINEFNIKHIVQNTEPTYRTHLTKNHFSVKMYIGSFIYI